MNLKTERTAAHRWVQQLLLMLMIVFACCIAPSAEARSTGVVGATMRDGGSGCAVGCHSAANGTVTVTTAGPTSLAPGQTGNYTVTNDYSANSVRPAGVNIATSDGTLIPAGNLTNNGATELFHFTPNTTNASGDTVFSFSWTMPGAAATGSAHTMYATGRVWVSGNWAHAANYGITTAAPFTALVNGSAAPGSIAVGGTGNLSTSGGAGSGGVSYSPSNSSICMVSGTTVTAVSVGTCTITANKVTDLIVSALSDAVSFSIVQATQTITFPLVAPKLASAAPFGVSATGGGSGNPITYVASGVCTNSGAIITLTGAVGTCTVTANQAGNANYLAAPTATLNISVVASGEVFPPNCQLPLGWTVPAGAATGWTVATDSTTSGVCSLKSNPLAIAAAGTVNKAQVEFTATFLAGNITFNRRVASEANWDCFRLLIDGVSQVVGSSTGCFGLDEVGISGLIPFGPASVPITAGSHTVTFSYETDDFFQLNGDVAWIDDLTLPLPLPVLTSASTATGAVGVAFSYSITASNSPWGYTATGLPPGLTVSTNGLISGVPTQVGTFTVMTQSNNGAGSTTTAITITIDRGPQTIPFAAISNKPVATVAFTLPAIVGGGSGNPVTYTVSGVCTSFMSLIAYSSLGTCSVTANQLGNANYLDAAPVTQSFLVFDPAAEYFPANCLMPAGWFVPTGLGWSPALDSAATGGCSLRANMDSTTNPLGVQYAGTFAAGNITFSRRVAAGIASFFGTSSCFRFSIDGVPQNIGGGICAGAEGQGGVVPFGTVSVPITAGFHTITWQSNPGNVFGFRLQADAWIDDVVLPQTTLTVTKAGGGGGTISTTPSRISNCAGSCSSTFTAGSVVAVTGNPTMGSYLSSWSGACAGSGACNVTMSASQAVTGTFSLVTAPGAPTGVGATPGNTSASVSFTAPAFNGGSPITNYRATCGSTFANGTGSPIIVSGLTNGVPVNCTVSASNAFASSLESSPPVAVTPRTVPGAPTGVGASPGNNQAIVSFTAPLSNGGNAITSFTATCGISSQTGLGSPLTVNFLTNGVLFNCAVTANNAAGSSAPSASVSVTPRTVPSAPTAPSATARDGRVSINFTASASDGGSAITGYAATCNPGAVTGVAASAPVTVSGLTNGITYTCAVAATNAAGSSAPSMGVAITPTLGSGTNLWTQVCASCHGTPPSGNQLNGAGTTNTVLSDILANLAPMNGIAQINALTPAELTAIANYIAQQLPTAPLVTAFNTPKLIDVGSEITLGTYSFESIGIVTGPTSGALSAITGTTFTYTPNMGFTGTDTFTFRGERATPTVLNGDPRTITITVSPPTTPSITSAPTASGTNGVAFNYQITASNGPTSFGASGLPAGLTVNTMTGAITGTPSVGGTFMATITASNAGGPGSATLTITLNPAAQFITFPPQTTVSRAFSPSPTNTFVLDPVATASSMLAVSYVSKTPGVCDVTDSAVSTVTMLSAGLCTIGANQIGTASFSVAAEVTQSITITPILPGAPTIGAATAGNLQASIAFTAPSNSGGTAITSYVASCTPSGTGSNAVSPITITGLTNGTLYTCSVSAANSVGSGPASGTVTVTPTPTPTPPIITSATSFSGFTVNQAGTTFTVTATGTPSTFTFSVAGTLPTGLLFNTGSGVLSGTPTQAGTFPLTFGASNTTPPAASQAFTLTVAKTSQTISFTNPGTQVFQISPVPLAATATSSLAVSFVSTTTGVCTISGANVLLVSLGTCSITAQQPGDANFNAAPTVSQSFSIVQGGQTITFGPQTSPFPFIQGAIFNLSPVAAASSALPVTYTSLTNTVCTIGGTTVTMQRAGQCTIAANQSGDGNVSAAAQVTQTISLTGVVPGAPVIGTATPSGGKATVSFTAPASDGGSAITLYTATCGGITGSAAASPVVVNGLTNGVQVSCSVTATNATGTSAASASVNVTPNPLPGAAIWATKCQSCHGLTPIGTRLNVGGSTSAVVAYSVANQLTMSTLPSLALASFPDVDRIAVAEYVRDFIPAVTASTPINTAVDISVGSQIFINTGVTGFTSLQVVAPPANGTLSAFFGTSVTYTPNPGFIGTDSFTYRGTQALLTGDPRTVTVTVTPGVPVIVSPASVFGTVGQPFSYQIIATNGPTSYGATGLPGTLTVNPTTGLISGTPLTSSPINATISATASGNTGSGPLTITINLNSQTINFGAQTSPQTFSAGGSFMIAPTATGGGSGNPVTYSSTTPGVCTVAAPNVLMLSAGLCTIAANQAGNATFNAAVQVTQNVTINPVVPSAPTIGAAIPADGQATVAFTASTFNGGSTITSYTLRCVGPTTLTASGSGPPLIVTGMTNGATYACNVFATNVAGNSADSATVNVTPSALPPLALASVVSRKTHGAAGNFSVPINPLTIPTGLVDVEPRIIGAGHTLVFSFNNPITAAGSVSTTIGSAVSSLSGNDVVVTLTAVPDNSRVTVTLTNVNGVATPFAASMGFLVGDVNATRSVSASDISGVKARSGQTTTGANFRFDVNATGAINASDISAVKARSGLTLPP